MLLHILGSCSGTEPMPGRDYTSWILEEDDGGLLWFDAGGGCASHAYAKGLSPLKVKALFLSHPHLDHTDAAAGDEWDFTPVVRELRPGELHRDGETAVEALPNRHMPPDPRSGKPRSYSFRLRFGPKHIVYTGDVGSLDELAAWLEQPTELLMAGAALAGQTASLSPPRPRNPPRSRRREGEGRCGMGGRRAVRLRRYDRSAWLNALSYFDHFSNYLLPATCKKRQMRPH